MKNRYNVDSLFTNWKLMDKLRAIHLFVRLADLGSFTGVADELGTTKSLVSKEIGRLEGSIGVRLLHRSTRSITLTPAGQGYLNHCRELLIKLADADAYVQALQGVTKGQLRINSPMALGMTDLSRAFSEFMALYPGISLDLHLSDEPIDLIEHGFDLGFRVTSKLNDSSYIGKTLTNFRYRVCASRHYLENHPAITHADDLRHHNCFVYSYFSGRNVWPLGKGVAVSGNLKANSSLLILEAVKAGQGVGLLPSFIADSELARGTVVEILADAVKPPLPLYALYPARDHLPPALTLCIEFLQEWFGRPRADQV